MQSLHRILVVLIFSLFMSGCLSTEPSEKTRDFSYEIIASENINPDINQQASSVLVRVYQLNNRVNFEKARYEDLFDSDKNTLGAEFISVNEYLIDPGTSKSLDADVSATTKFIGIAVGFRSANAVNWRTIVSMPEKSSLDPMGLFGSGGVQIIIDDLSVRTTEL
ncbi:type VI secretion system lipoprotein TssJ [Glaciecola sp. 1036]|uniref:type VI secretion system lipoprotein TssJ n=1 Tax=Alteromonadaceae TaxID=72275 RepID=UPI003D00AE89